MWLALNIQLKTNIQKYLPSKSLHLSEQLKKKSLNYFELKHQNCKSPLSSSIRTINHGFSYWWLRTIHRNITLCYHRVMPSGTAEGTRLLTTLPSGPCHRPFSSEFFLCLLYQVFPFLTNYQADGNSPFWSLSSPAHFSLATTVVRKNESHVS